MSGPLRLCIFLLIGIALASAGATTARAVDADDKGCDPVHYEHGVWLNADYEAIGFAAEEDSTTRYIKGC